MSQNGAVLMMAVPFVSLKACEEHLCSNAGVASVAVMYVTLRVLGVTHGMTWNRRSFHQPFSPSLSSPIKSSPFRGGGSRRWKRGL